MKILSRSEHPITRKAMNPSALKVMYRLKSKGYMALLVGGALRDLFRDKTPRDFDIATDASIDEIRAHFRNSKTIGKRFPIVHTYFGNEVVEISSMKGEPGQDKYELIYDDASRRDFTVNAIYYDIVDFKVIDPLDALEDLEAGRVVSIGDPAERFEEDPIRMLRAVKLAAKQGFSMGPELIATIRDHQDWTSQLGAGRRYEELTRVLLDEDATRILSMCDRYGLLERLWPEGKTFIDGLGLERLDTIRRQVPLVYTRGSFSKKSHTHLWLKLFLESSFYAETTSPVEIKNALIRFLGPLGMPFQGPILDAALWLNHVRTKSGTQPGSRGINGEVIELLTHLAEQASGKEAAALEALVERALSEKSQRKNRRRKRGKSKTKGEERNTKPEEGGKKRRRRRRRRRGPRKSKPTE